MIPSALTIPLGGLALIAGVVLVLYAARGLRRGWFMRKDGAAKVRRNSRPFVFWFEATASIALALCLFAVAAHALLR